MITLKDYDYEYKVKNNVYKYSNFFMEGGKVIWRVLLCKPVLYSSYELDTFQEAVLDESNYCSFKPNNLSHLLVLLSMVGLIATTTSLLVFNTMLESLLRPTAMASCSCRSLAVVPLSKVNLWTQTYLQNKVNMIMIFCTKTKDQISNGVAAYHQG